MLPPLDDDIQLTVAEYRDKLYDVSYIFIEDKENVLLTLDY